MYEKHFIGIEGVSFLSNWKLMDKLMERNVQIFTKLRKSTAKMSLCPCLVCRIQSIKGMWYDSKLQYVHMSTSIICELMWKTSNENVWFHEHLSFRNNPEW